LKHEFAFSKGFLALFPCFLVKNEKSFLQGSFLFSTLYAVYWHEKGGKWGKKPPGAGLGAVELRQRKFIGL
jgi:hypothetical protein